MTGLNKRKLLIYLVAMLAGMAASFLFLMGGMSACKMGGGVYEFHQCVEPEVVKTCEFEGKIYRMPEVDQGVLVNWSLG